MAYQSVGNLLLPLQEISSARAIAMDADAHYLAHALTIWKPGNLKKVHFRTGTVTTSDTLKVAIQDIGSNGEPDGSDDISTTIGSLTTNTWHAATFAGTLAVSAGDRKAVIFSFNSYVAGNLELIVNNANTDTILSAYTLDDLGVSSWSPRGWGPLVGLEYDDGTFGTVVNGPTGLDVSESFNSLDTPDEVGNRFSFPFPVVVSGVRARVRNYNDNGDFDAVLYHSGGSVSSEIRNRLYSGAAGWGVFTFAETEIAANSEFRLAIKAQHTTQVTELTVREFLSSAARSQEEFGAECQYTSRSDGGEWSQNTTKQSHVFPIFSKLDDGAGEAGPFRWELSP